MDDLTLPNPARELWLETRDVVRRALEQLQPGIEYRIGGGTILAAGWKHRGSFDVDLQVPKGTKLAEQNASWRTATKFQVYVSDGGDARLEPRR